MSIIETCRCTILQKLQLIHNFYDKKADVIKHLNITPAVQTILLYCYEILRQLLKRIFGYF